MALALNIGKCTLLGNYRENNEDSIDVKVFPDMTVCLVADGMGGQAAGEVASKRAIEIVPRELKKNLSAAMSNDETRNVLRRAIVRRGVPEVLYCDNGAPFRNAWLARTCAVLGVRLVHSQPYSPLLTGQRLIHSSSRAAEPVETVEMPGGWSTDVGDLAAVS